MKKTCNVVLSTMLMLIFITGTIHAIESSPEEYFSEIKSSIKNDRIDKIKVTPMINIKAVSKGMNLGYLDPKLNEIKDTKKEVEYLISRAESAELSNSKLIRLNDELLTRLNTMVTYLERSENQYESLIGYDRHYIGKYFTLKLGDIFIASADDNLKYYNKDYKEVKRIYRDMKQVIKDM